MKFLVLLATTFLLFKTGQCTPKPKVSGGDCNEAQDCPEHASCLPDKYKSRNFKGLCKCDEGFIAASKTLQCVQMKTNGEECEATTGNPCDPIARLSCLENTKTCGCPSGKQLWNQDSKQCRDMLGEKCSTYTPTCIPNAMCGFVGYSSTCMCNQGFTASGNGLCLANHWSSCKTSSDCMPGNVCVDDTCKCPQPLRQRYDEKSKSCVNLLDAVCKMDGSQNTSSKAIEGCPENSACVEERCKCLPGFQKIPGGQCAKGVSADCSGRGECDFSQGLGCIEGKCNCMDASLKFTNENGCVAELGSTCGWIEPIGACSGPGRDNQGNPMCDYYHVSCEGSAVCRDMGRGWSQCNRI